MLSGSCETEVRVDVSAAVVVVRVEIHTCSNVLCCEFICCRLGQRGSVLVDLFFAVNYACH